MIMSEIKNLRRKIIADAIRERVISDQSALVALLEEHGIYVSQPTLSRDLNDMGVRKIHLKKDNALAYCLPQDVLIRGRRSINDPVADAEVPHLPQGTEGFKNIALSPGMIVVRTQPGWAQPLAVKIDSTPFVSISGTIAGVDTLFIAIAQGFTHSEVLRDLSLVMPEALLFIPS